MGLTRADYREGRRRQQMTRESSATANAKTSWVIEEAAASVSEAKASFDEEVIVKVRDSLEKKDLTVVIGPLS